MLQVVGALTEVDTSATSYVRDPLRKRRSYLMSELVAQRLEQVRPTLDLMTSAVEHEGRDAAASVTHRITSNGRRSAGGRGLGHGSRPPGQLDLETIGRAANGAKETARAAYRLIGSDVHVDVAVRTSNVDPVSGIRS